MIFLEVFKFFVYTNESVNERPILIISITQF